jgi:hypothetical protein
VLLAFNQEYGIDVSAPKFFTAEWRGSFRGMTTANERAAIFGEIGCHSFLELISLYCIIGPCLPAT